MSAIVTITFNPCIDKSTTVPTLVPDKKMRCTTPVFEPGGGGLNVARALKKLGVVATAVFPAGSYSGNFLQTLVAAEEVPFRAIETGGHTRENMIVLDEGANLQYRFGMPGPKLTEAEWQRCVEAIFEQQSISMIVASGSLPQGVPSNVFRRLSIKAKERNIKLIADTSGEALREALDAGVYLAKPNLAELSHLAGGKEMDITTIMATTKKIIEHGKCEVMVTSLGAAGALLITKDEAWKAAAPVVKRKSTVGAGDSMVAGMVCYIQQGQPMCDVLRYGVACGTAATLNSGTELCKKADAEKLLPQVTVTRLS